MMTEETVKTLSSAKQRKSLGHIGKKEKVGRKQTRTTIVNPIDVEWPDVDEATSAELLSKIGIAMKCLKIPNKNVPLGEIKGVKKEDRSAVRKKWITENAIKVGYDINNFTRLRMTISIGVNIVVKALETDKLVAVVIEKEVNPQIITKLIIPIANHKQVPIVSLSGLNEAFEKATGIRCIALGFKEPCNEFVSEFYWICKAVKDSYFKKYFVPGGPVIINLPRMMETTLPESESISSSTQEDTDLEGRKAQLSSQEKKRSLNFSIEQEIDKLNKKNETARKKMSPSKDKPFVSVKVRRVTPNQTK